MSISRALSVVKPTESGDTPALVEQLSHGEVDHLAEYFQGGHVAAHVQQAAVRLIQSLIAKRMWVACGCTGALSAETPLLFPRSVPRSASRPAVLVPLYGRNPHKAGCDFERDKPDLTDTPTHQPRSTITGMMSVLPSMSAPSTTAPTVAEARELHDTPRAHAEKQTPKLAAVLFTLLEGAGLNVLQEGKLSTTDAKSRLEVEIRKHFIALGKSLFDWCKLSFYGAQPLLKKLEKQDQKDWGKTVPQGFIIEQVIDYQSNATSHALTNVHGEQFSFTGRLIVPGANTPGPWLAIALASRRPNVSAEFDQVYLHPMDSEREYFLVDSDLERHTLRILRRDLSKMKRASKPYTIIKPLTDLTVMDGKTAAKVRPDFILRANPELKRDALIVETMGYEDAAYTTRKLQTHRLMLLLPKTLDLVPHEKGSDEDLKKSIERYIS
ncbi:hypothetical protein [Stenotrophomonas maltophilia]|uniref:hypothetical protein n=1 Tax=Stenotrophomonas maltophilia TaxID=40324 RepID=UPI0039C351B0